MKDHFTLFEAAQTPILRPGSLPASHYIDTSYESFGEQSVLLASSSYLIISAEVTSPRVVRVESTYELST